MQHRVSIENYLKKREVQAPFPVELADASLIPCPEKTTTASFLSIQE